jgi:hypothetical protein
MDTRLFVCKPDSSVMIPFLTTADRLRIAFVGRSSCYILVMIEWLVVGKTTWRLAMRGSPTSSFPVYRRRSVWWTKLYVYPPSRNINTSCPIFQSGFSQKIAHIRAYVYAGLIFRCQGYPLCRSWWDAASRSVCIYVGTASKSPTWNQNPACACMNQTPTTLNIVAFPRTGRLP